VPIVDILLHLVLAMAVALLSVGLQVVTGGMGYFGLKAQVADDRAAICSKLLMSELSPRIILCSCGDIGGGLIHQRSTVGAAMEFDIAAK
jgi:hypothetical protein